MAHTLMAKTSAIEWTDATWNPWMGCAKVSAGCKNCYMFRDQKRFGHGPTVLRRSKTTIYDPLKWKEPRRIFVCSWSDFFWDQVPIGWVTDALSTMYEAPQHTFMLLTKRPENILSVIHRDSFIFLPNVWIGVSVESQDHIDRIGQLYDVPATMKFLSAEPLLGPLDLSEHMGLLDWVITGGESGGAERRRTMDLDWVRSIRDECEKHGVAFFHKQHGGSVKYDGAWGGRYLDGRTWDEFPEAHRGLFG